MICKMIEYINVHHHPTSSKVIILTVSTHGVFAASEGEISFKHLLNEHYN